MSDDKHFNPEKVFLLLFLLTFLEVGWGYIGHALGWGNVLLWGGLLFFAFYKGWLIAVFFMHLKFEGWVVKSLIIPTPFLIMVIFGYVVPDVANKDGNQINPVGAQVDPATGTLRLNMDENPDAQHGSGEEH